MTGNVGYLYLSRLSAYLQCQSSDALLKMICFPTATEFENIFDEIFT